MDTSVAAIRLASGVVAPLVKKLFRGEGAGAGLVDRPVRIASYVSLRERRVLTGAELHMLAAKLVAEALRAPGERPLQPGEEAGVTTALAATLHCLGDITLTDLEAVRLGPRAFARVLRNAAPYRGLSDDAELFYRRVLELACLHILNFFTQRSTFVAATLVEQSRRQGELISKVDELLTRVPRRDGRDAAFERRYLDYLARRHGTLTIFGLDLAPGSSRWPLDAAYVSLEVDRAAPAPASAPAPGGGLLPADAILGEYRRVLLRGEAGSGKTTLIQWLAVAAAREPAARHPTPHLLPPVPAAADHIPYVLPLRTLTRNGERLPAPAEFLAGSPLSGEAPDGWTGRVLRDGRALVLVDGIDEIPEAERPRARDWLADLITAYPDNRWLVTSRPSAVRHDWLADVDFAEVTLAPMTPANVRAFIERWHDAADDVPREYRDQLLDSVATKPDLARLATNPLLCGLICALHRERRGFLPSGRRELYSAALSMLLHRRDRERGLRLPYIAEEPQLQLLQRLAFWLIRNGRTEMSRDQAESLIGKGLPSVPAAAVLGEAPAVFRHFLERTGLLRAPTVDTVQFVHRTFQDFLGARAALDEGSLSELTRHAEDDQWEDVIRMAVAQGRPRDRSEIMRDLLAARSTRAVLLAFACLEDAAELEPELREEIRAAAIRLVPPTDSEVAGALARVGPLILDVLPGPGAGMSDTEATYTVLAAGWTGSERAIPFLARFADHPSAAVRAELDRLWQRFDTRRYAEEVIVRLDPPPKWLSIVGNTQLSALPEFARPPGLVIGRGVTRSTLAAFLRGQPVQRLYLHEFRDSVGDLEFLRGHSSLRELDIQSWPTLRDLSGLHGLPLEDVTLYMGSVLDVAAATASWPRLHRLRLRGVRTSWSFTDLNPAAPLEELDLQHVPADLAGLGRLRSLSVLRLGRAWRPSTKAAWAELSRLEHLERLVLSAETLGGLVECTRLPSLREVWVYPYDDVSAGVEERVRRRFPRAKLMEIPEETP
ncbi:NACHT domain-containing protein [Streptomyces sp. NPDC048340]|uniref:NACHT domain-containing protein n=1 Tax=Streptomyces sp. NPDC048340 TaxID=3365537 RepID=UPI0037217288